MGKDKDNMDDGKRVDPYEYLWDEDVRVTDIDLSRRVVRLSNGFVCNHKRWWELFANFWDKRIIGKSIVPVFYEYLFARGGTHQYSQLVKGKEHEGFLLGQMGKPLLDARKAIAVGTIIVLMIAVTIVIVILRNQSII